MTLNNLGVAYHELGVAQQVSGEFFESKKNVQKAKRVFEQIEVTEQNRDTVLTNWGIILQNEATFCVDANDKEGKQKQIALIQEATEKLGAAKYCLYKT